MQTITITVAAIEWPKPDKKLGAIIDSSGQRFGVWPDKLPGYQQGRSYEIGYESSEFKGKTYYTVKTATPVSGTGAGLIIPRAAPTPPPRNEDADNQRRMDIFICGGFNNFMSNPTVKPMEISTEQMAEMVRRLKKVWQLSLGPQAQEAVERGALDRELDDKIPF